MTEAEIQRCLATTLFHWRRHICVPNVDWGFLPWEADLVVLRPSGWCDEIEIKTSIADLRRDKHKLRHRLQPIMTWEKYQRIRKRYYAAPAEVWAKVKDDDLPDGSGRIVITDVDGRLRATIVVEAKIIPGSRRLNDSERFALARLGCLRYWCREPRK